MLHGGLEYRHHYILAVSRSLFAGIVFHAGASVVASAARAAIVFTALSRNFALKRIVDLKLNAADVDVVGGDDLEGLDDVFELPSSADVGADEVFKNAVDSVKDERVDGG